jgi:hypothetical protein
VRLPNGGVLGQVWRAGLPLSLQQVARVNVLAIEWGKRDGDLQI